MEVEKQTVFQVEGKAWKKVDCVYFVKHFL